MVDYTTICSAYETISREYGYSFIRIHPLRVKLGLSVDEMKDILYKMSREGLALLSCGDWSVASEDERASSIPDPIDKKERVLLVKIEAELIRHQDAQK